MAKEKLSEEEKYAVEFLGRDFDQSYQQMRHHNSQILSIFKFMFTIFIALIGASAGLFEVSAKENIDLTLAALLILIFGFILGVFFFAIIVRNRVYFVIEVRYLNEQRALFLKYKPLGFENITGKYTDISMPTYFNWRGSQALFMYTLAFMNAVLLVGFTFILTSRVWGQPAIFWLIVAFVFALGLQLPWGILYLKTRENKPPEKAVGKKEK